MVQSPKIRSLIVLEDTTDPWTPTGLKVKAFYRKGNYYMAIYMQLFIRPHNYSKFFRLENGPPFYLGTQLRAQRAHSCATENLGSFSFKNAASLILLMFLLTIHFTQFSL